jgi:hypothetical protein
VGMAELSAVLWRERELLDVLLFKLEEEQLLLAAGRSEWLARATREVEVVLEAIASSELTRAVEVDVVAESLGLPPNSSLGQLSRAAPAPWDELLADHRRCFLELTGRISALAAANRDLITSSRRAVTEALSAIAGPAQPPMYGPSGTTVATITGPRFLDEAI